MRSAWCKSWKSGWRATATTRSECSARRLPAALPTRRRAQLYTRNRPAWRRKQMTMGTLRGISLESSQRRLRRVCPACAALPSRSRSPSRKHGRSPSPSPSTTPQRRWHAWWRISQNTPLAKRWQRYFHLNKDMRAERGRHCISDTQARRQAMLNEPLPRNSLPRNFWQFSDTSLREVVAPRNHVERHAVQHLLH